MQRLQKFLSAAGVDSRRNCEQLILDGAVSVNGKLVDSLPAFINPESDTVKVHGKIIRHTAKVYYLLNKPKGVLCTNKDQFGRKTAIELIPTKQRLFCVGRLDADTTGAIIITNDTELANRLTHPKFGLQKTYLVAVKGKITAEAVEKIKKGVWLAEKKTSRAQLKVIKTGSAESLLEITIKEGLNRQIRRMFAKVGFKVKSLKRTAIGNINIKGIGVGKYKALTAGQIKYLKTKTNVSE